MNLEPFFETLNLESQAIQEAEVRLSASPQAVQQALQLLIECGDAGGKVVVSGVGKSGKVGQKIAATLSSTGCLSIFLHPTEGLHGDLGVLTPKDVILAISQSGNTDELMQLVPSLQDRQIPIIAITGNTQSRLAKSATATIDSAVKAEACPHNLTPTTSTTLTLALGDALAITLMRHRNFKPDQFKLNHPGGALGRRLQLKVKDLMIPSPQVSWATSSDSITQLAEQLSETRHGAVLVGSPETSFEGLIVEGDLRRAMISPTNFFKKTATDLLNANPVTVLEQDSALEALETMEDREFPIGVLPVVNSSGGVTGLLRLHDLLQVF